MVSLLFCKYLRMFDELGAYPFPAPLFSDFNRANIWAIFDSGSDGMGVLDTGDFVAACPANPQAARRDVLLGLTGAWANESPTVQLLKTGPFENDSIVLEYILFAPDTPNLNYGLYFYPNNK